MSIIFFKKIPIFIHIKALSTIYSYIIKAHTKYIDFNFIQSGDNMNCLKIIFVYIGLIIGAGFASGREICEYFNFCSNTDYTGVCIASILFIFVCYAIIKKVNEV